MAVLYIKSPERMTFSQAETYCRGQGLELAVEPKRVLNPAGYNHVGQ